MMSLANAASSACALDALDSNPFPSPLLSAALAVGLRNPGAPPPLGVTVRSAVRVVPPEVPVTVTTVELGTLVVATVNVALVAPAPTVTLAGTDATAGLLLDNVTVCPPAGAAALSVAVPCDGEPPIRLEGFRFSDASVGDAETPGSTHRTG